MRRVGLIGHGAIGEVVAAELASGRVEGCELSGVFTASDRCDVPLRARSIDDLIETSDIVVEAAGHRAVGDFGPRVLNAGVDLLVVSVGALVDEELRRALTGAHGGGRLLLSAGAIGGLGLLRAAALMGSLRSVRLVTTKSPAALFTPQMAPALAAEVEQGRDPVVVFDGSAREAVARFPASVNVAATLALATIGLERTRVTIMGDRTAERVRHVIEVDAEAGRYELHIENTPSTNPRTSGITAYNVLRALGDMTDAVVVGL